MTARMSLAQRRALKAADQSLTGCIPQNHLYAAAWQELVKAMISKGWAMPHPDRASVIVISPAGRDAIRAIGSEA